MEGPFERVLVANRGEIAVRVIRAVRELGGTAVAVFTGADGGARHVREADLAYQVPTYLDADAIVAVAVRAGAQALHPGYGFLSESPVLAAACAAAGIVWVGPDERALTLMGDKIGAKAHVAALGVPVVPGVSDLPAPRSTDVNDRNPALAARAGEVGFPLIVKPSAGGGGKGMQVVHEEAELPEALAAARRVAAAAFGDDTLLLERLVVAPRHIEAQVLGDRHGRIEVLGLRECSLQRRHQKEIEEAPAPYPHGAVREAIAAAAAQVAASVGYVGAGTVEFLVSGVDPQQWYFLEMNTRLQVEHPVTEEVTGVDLVVAQLRVAAGEPISIGEIGEAGHAIEARVYAERPERGFVPSTGRLLQVAEPVGVRVDSGVSTGSVVTAHYDPMLLKVIAHGTTRAEAIQRLDAALATTVVLGVHTNIAYLRSVLKSPEVLDATADTAFLDTLEPPAPTEPDAGVLAAAAWALRPMPDGGSSPWASRSGWRLGQHRAPTVSLLVGEHVHDTPIPAQAPTGVRCAVEQATAWLWHDGESWQIRQQTREEAVERSRRERAGAAPDPQVRTPMPGTVVAIPATDGAPIEVGEVVAVVEAMKMENPVTAPVAGKLVLAVRRGETVTADQLLATIHTHTHGGSAPVAPAGAPPQTPSTSQTIHKIRDEP
ncbi:acetyl/propionyl/methylcrotonyl-CoA carboxylase subunit alpha [Pseudactinotalea terrae]|uniref:acetyl/propionyl/methylcrotonyl-CoA carboxylase subunit alpha n=1 Tax=Pseudactinotalea terrae TaxID=1743262 RepID=UPI0012E0D1AD|nr:biotin carboxylase N-terminal domain-containing protein [Pseudactinotalea terrae]